MDEALEVLSEDPAFLDWIASYELREVFPDQAIHRAAAYVSPKVITGLKARVTASGDIIIEANVQGSRRTPYKVTVECFEDEWDGWCLDERCTCPVGDYCKHSIAVIIYLRTILSRSQLTDVSCQSSLPKNILSWLRGIEAASMVAVEKSPKKSASNPKFLAWCIEVPSHGDSIPYLTPRTATMSKSGGFSVDRGVAQANPIRPAKYMAEEDLPIAVLYHQIVKKQQGWDRISMEGPDTAHILDLALATGRLFFGKRPLIRRLAILYHRISVADPIHLTPAWQIDSDGSARPVLNGLPEGIRWIPTSPPRYLDEETSTIGTITSELTSELLDLWRNGPEVPADFVPQTSERINSLPRASVPAPVKFETEHHPSVLPTAFLNILRNTVVVANDSVDLIYALPTFQYGDSPPFPPAGHGSFPHEHAVIKDGKRSIWKRDLEAENQFTHDLGEVGLIRIDEMVSRTSVPLGLESALVTESPRPTPKMAWLLWLEGSDAEALRESGWTILVDPKAGLAMHDVSEFLPAIEAETDHGIDWFRFDVSFEIDGENRSLIPLIAQAIASDFPPSTDPELPEWITLSCENPEDGFIRLPAKRFLEIVEQVRHLFHGRDPDDGPITLDRLSAAGVADSLDLRSSDTLRTLAALGRSLKDIHELPQEDVPSSVNATLRPYQQEGFRWLRFLATHGLSGILADDMGLGKTLQALTYLAAEHAARPGYPSLVVAPTSVVPNWAAEAAKFTPDLKILTLHGPNRLAAFGEIPAADLVITSYPLLHRDIDRLTMQRWHSVILDEAQQIKNPKSVTARAACALEASHRLCLSGTPMENHLGELWSLMRFLMPGFLPDEKSFNSVVRKPIERDRSGDAQLALNRRISPLILRRTKDQVAPDLPPKTEIIHHIDLTRKQIDLYESVRATMDKRVRDAIAAKGLAKSHIIVLDALLKLRQICCHPALLTTAASNKVTESAKLDFLTTELLPQLLEEGRRILLFSQFTSMLALIEAHLEKESIPYLKLTGQTKNRAALVKEFQTGEIPIFLISLKAGGTGLNLTAADTVIHYDPWWNPAAENQASDRAHRIGQSKPVFVHKLVCRGSIEDRILDLQKHKSALVKALLSEETTRLSITPETISQLLAPLQ